MIISVKLMIQVSVKLFASLRAQYPDIPLGQPMAVQLSQNATLADLVKMLNLKAAKIIFVNGIAQTDLNHSLQDHDDIAVFPPLAGG
jgi:molybdopterin converting factor small subunit